MFYVFAICTQAPTSATSTAATSTGVFLGQQPYGGFTGSSNQTAQLYAQQLQGKLLACLQLVGPPAHCVAPCCCVYVVSMLQQGTLLCLGCTRDLKAC